MTTDLSSIPTTIPILHADKRTLSISLDFIVLVPSTPEAQAELTSQIRRAIERCVTSFVGSQNSIMLGQWKSSARLGPLPK